MIHCYYNVKYKQSCSCITNLLLVMIAVIPVFTPVLPAILLICLIFVGALMISISLFFEKCNLIRAVWATLLQYGTEYRYSLLLIIGYWLIATVFIYSDKDNVTRSNEYLIVHQKIKIEHGAESLHIQKHHDTEIENWTWEDALLLSLRYHIPVIPNVARHDYILKDSGNIHVNWVDSMLYRNCYKRISPDTYGALMYILNWFLWPISIILFTRWAMRQS